MPPTHITTCLLCPPENPARIKADKIPQVLPGEAPSPAVGRYVQALSTHLERKHPEAYDTALKLSQTFFAMLILQSFETSDPAVANGEELIRAFIHRMTRKNDVDERELQIRCEELGFEPSERLHARDAKFDRSLEILRDLRDYLLEEGEYAVRAPEGEAVKA
jgi:hypothetical protein